MTRRSLYEVLEQRSEKKIDDKFVFLLDHLKNITKCPAYEEIAPKTISSPFKFQFKQKWEDTGRKRERFLKDNEQWLNTTIALPTWTVAKLGRRQKNFVNRVHQREGEKQGF